MMGITVDDDELRLPHEYFGFSLVKREDGCVKFRMTTTASKDELEGVARGYQAAINACAEFAMDSIEPDYDHFIQKVEVTTKYKYPPYRT